MTEDAPWDEEGNAFTATFKAGKGFEDPWLVLRAGSASTLRDRVMQRMLRASAR